MIFELLHLNRRGEPIRFSVRPDYINGAKARGPVGWLQRNGEDCGATAIAVGGHEAVAREKSISYTPIDDAAITEVYIDGKPVGKGFWEHEFLAACGRV